MDKVLGVAAAIAVKNDKIKGYLAEHAGVFVCMSNASRIWLIDGESVRLLEYADADQKWLRDVATTPYRIETRNPGSEYGFPTISVNGGPWTSKSTCCIDEILRIMYDMDPLLKLAAHGDGSAIEVFPELENTLTNYIDDAIYVLRLASAMNSDLIVENINSKTGNVFLANPGGIVKTKYNCDVKIIEL